MTCEMVPVVVSICGAAVETLTVSVTAPMLSVTFRVWLWSACSRMPLLTTVAKPGAETDRS